MRKKVIAGVAAAAIALSVGAASVASAHGGMGGKGGAGLSSLLSDLVTKGTITQSQADAIVKAQTDAKALAELLNGNAGAVVATIDASNEKEMALSAYLKAVAAARNNNASEVISNLKTAIEKDGSLKSAAKDDAEFIKLRDNAEFKSLAN